MTNKCLVCVNNVVNPKGIQFIFDRKKKKQKIFGKTPEKMNKLCSSLLQLRVKHKANELLTWQVCDDQAHVYAGHTRLISSSSLHKKTDGDRISCFFILSCRISCFQNISAILVYDRTLCKNTHTHTHATCHSPCVKPQLRTDMKQV